MPRPNRHSGTSKKIGNKAPQRRLVDRFGRLHDSLRISVTDRCNIRCFYCMPEHNVQFLPRRDLLSFEEITRVARLLVDQCGVGDLRITGGEPLVRKQLCELVASLAKIDGLEDLSMTTNGVLLAENAESLKAAGLKRVNISLDTLDPAKFALISRRDNLNRVIEGIHQAIAVQFDQVKLNALAIAGLTESELIDLVRFAADRKVMIRFIEFMPLDADQAWTRENVLDGDAILKVLEREFGRLLPLQRSNAAEPADSFVTSGGTRVGIIRSVTQPFCDQCNRIRLTADGAIRNCLFSTEEFSIRDLIRSGGDDAALIDSFVTAVAAKHAAHGIGADDFRPPDRPMYSIGG